LFAQPLRGSNATSLADQIGIAKADTTPAPVTGVTHYTVGIQQFTDTLHPALGPTTLWGFVPTNYLVNPPIGGPKHLGGIILAEKNVPLQFTFRNTLPTTHPLMVDTTLLLAAQGGSAAVNRAAVHVHGGLTPWISDGGPFAWHDPLGNHGPSFLNNTVLNPGAPITDAEYYFTNDQSARMLWYHDHAVGLTRLNAYAGIASAWIIRDPFELSVGLPRIEAPVTGAAVPNAELIIVVQDKIFVNSATIAAMDPTWTGPNTTGSLWYPHVYEKVRWRTQGPGVPPNPSVVPEAFGDTMLVNGTVYPEVSVEPKIYRIQLLNACNARFLNLQLYTDDGTPNHITLNAAGNPTNAPGPIPTGATAPSFRVIGTEAGFLPHPVDVPSNATFNPVSQTGGLVTAPAERWDLLIDFRAFAGRSLILYNDAPAPFPVGDTRNDYFPGFNITGSAPNPVNAGTPAGQGPNTRCIMRFNVGGTVTSPGAPDLLASFDFTPGIDPFEAPIVGGVPVPPAGVPVRQLTLNETFDANGRLIQLLGTNVRGTVKNSFGRPLTDPATETPTAGSVEIWEIANLTADTHPMHFHLVQAQIINRQPIKVNSYNGTPSFLVPTATAPDPQELGWKETIRMPPGAVTRIIMRFTLPVTPFTVPTSGRTGGFEYVWHCHILEHEEHDMMRPLVVM
jgi:spore coat protein A